MTSPPDFDTLFEELRVSEVGSSSGGITWFPAEQGCSWEIDGKPVSKETEIGVADGEVASMGSGFGLRLELADLITSQQFDQTPVLTHYPDGRTAYRFELLGDQQPTVRGHDDSGTLVAGNLTALLYFFKMTKPKRTAKGLLFGPRPMGPGPQPRNPDTGLIEPVEEEDDGDKRDAFINPTDIQDLLAELDGEPTVAEVRDVLKKLLNLLA